MWGLQSHKSGCTMFRTELCKDVHFAEDVMQEGFKDLLQNKWLQERSGLWGLVKNHRELVVLIFYKKTTKTRRFWYYAL
jgi:hypothetical protein